MSIVGLLINFSLLLISVSLHEFSHGWVAYKLGDNTAKNSGRLTLNPLAHIDLFGTIILPITLFITTSGNFVFGAAKPVPINYMALRNPKRDIIWVGASGPASNLIFAGILAILWRMLPYHPIIDYIILMLITINVILALFNLVPIPPLDGSRIIMGILPDKISRVYASIEPYGFIIVIFLIFAGLFGAIVEPVARILLSWLIKPL